MDENNKITCCKKMLNNLYKKIRQTVLTKTIIKRPAGKEFISDELYRDD